MSATASQSIQSKRSDHANDDVITDAAMIALIDDDRSWIETVSDVLTSEGYEVCSASSPEDALDLLDSAQPHLIILDVHIQGANGLRLLADFRSQNRTTPVLVVSADDRTLVRNQAMNMGASGFLQKPITSKLLIQAIRHCLRPSGDNSRASKTKAKGGCEMPTHQPSRRA